MHVRNALVALVALALGPADALWPIPKAAKTGDKFLFIDQTVKVTYNGHRISYTAGYEPPAGPRFNSKDIVQGGVSRALGAIFQQGFVPWMLRGRDDKYEPDLHSAPSRRIKTLEITQTGNDSTHTFKPLAGQLDESYTLNVTADGKASIRAGSSIGVLRALETFSQLFWKHSSGTAWYTALAPVSVSDAPKFPHRGILLDVSRHWFPVEDIKRTIDGLAMNKMNVLHLHITDTQSWPLEVPSMPRLTEFGAYAPGLTYSPKDIAGLYEYAIHRGVQIIMEIDMPGHIGIEKAYPGKSVAFNAKPYEWYCSQPPCGSFKLNSSDTYEFLDKLFKDLLPRVAPYSAYFHTGGDEYKANNSLLDPGLRTNDLAILQPMLQKFLDYAHGKVRAQGLAPFVWEEMVLQWNATVGKDVVIQSWLGAGAIKKLADAGHQVIDSSNEFLYLDCGRGEWIDYETGPAFQKAYPFNDWCNPTKNWRLIYTHDPLIGLSKESAKRVIGGETPVWTETIDPASVDTIIWPRGAAAGEAWWSGYLDPDTGRNRSMYDVRVRLSEQRERMLARGVKATAITQLWCDQAAKDDCAGTQ
ncbi:glycoside hydrolase family 20 [Purpureocillium lilacinum]|uniref:Beta-hexosaminidase n=1 Tax=Purpureocillium lilacinum TaxID=33203 RepID=A0A179HLY7_PURLI|nr:glycoside hydrolase family 20 [Purpureocillium lilacinum]OAQ90480.1 glycoside hydrolase family 20 [Purpureocillium lilacinum]